MSKQALSNLHVLIALRDAAWLKSYREHLADEGFLVSTATDGLACLALLRRIPPDVLVIERDLPWGGGDGVLAWMDEEAEAPNLPAIVFSSGIKLIDRADEAAVPDREYVDRHLRPQDLVRRIRLLADIGAREEGRRAGVSFAFESAGG